MSDVSPNQEPEFPEFDDLLSRVTFSSTSGMARIEANNITGELEEVDKVEYTAPDAEWLSASARCSSIRDQYKLLTAEQSSREDRRAIVLRLFGIVNETANDTERELQEELGNIDKGLQNDIETLIGDIKESGGDLEERFEAWQGMERSEPQKRFSAAQYARTQVEFETGLAKLVLKQVAELDPQVVSECSLIAFEHGSDEQRCLATELFRKMPKELIEELSILPKAVSALTETISSDDEQASYSKSTLPLFWLLEEFSGSLTKENAEQLLALADHVDCCENHRVRPDGSYKSCVSQAHQHV